MRVLAWIGVALSVVNIAFCIDALVHLSHSRVLAESAIHDWVVTAGFGWLGVFVFAGAFLLWVPRNVPK
jgi:hypothetical protein